MPTYNEAANVGPMINLLFGEVFPVISGADMSLLVVDDDSPDGTGEIVGKMQACFDRLYLSIGIKTGLGHAYVRGMRYAMDRLGADAVVEMDADFQHDPKYLIPMVKAFAEGADYVIGSRFTPGGSIPPGWAWHRRAVSILGNAFARRMLKLPGIHDLTTGFRLTRVRGVLDRIDLTLLMALNRFAYKVDLLYRSVMLAERTVEVPIHFLERHDERSKFSVQEIFSTLKVVIRLRFISKSH
ncbi:MAG: polyprenol monophosphomannose synthase [Desulfobacterales bacterium]|nr:polyprenol monophosphomannose synthase [Desulfobacterales bacterium]